MLDERDYGVGLITPGRVDFTGGFAGKPGPNDTRGNSTGYLASQAMEILDHNIVYEFEYELVLGTLSEIRARAAQRRPKNTPSWTFTASRQGWHYLHASDAGWPVKEHLEIKLDQDDPQLTSPQTFWQAAEAPYLVIEAAFHTTQKQGAMMWQPHGEKGFPSANYLSFPLTADGEFHRHVIPLGEHPSYQGSLIRLRIDPVGQAEPGAWMKLRSVRLQKTPD